MILQTKFDIGDKVYLIHKNKVHQGVIDHICIKYSALGMEVCHYHIIKDEDYETIVRTEDYIFLSKQDILDKLFSND